MIKVNRSEMKVKLTMEVKNGNVAGKDQLLSLYQSVGWTEYTKDPDQLIRALHHSLDVLTLWDQNQLVGLIRTIGDDETILYIQDLLIHPNYQHQGWGTTLLKRVCERHPNIRQKVLLTDNLEKNNLFYEKNGFSLVDKLGMHCYYFNK